MKALFDTNILIDYFNGVAEAHEELERYEDRAISVITWIEALAGATEVTEEPTRAFLSTFEMIGLDERVAQLALEIRRTRRLKLPDAVVWACAKRDGRLLVTRDARAFPAQDPGVRIPYRPMV